MGLNKNTTHTGGVTDPGFDLSGCGSALSKLMDESLHAHMASQDCKVHTSSVDERLFIFVEACIAVDNVTYEIINEFAVNMLVSFCTWVPSVHPPVLLKLSKLKNEGGVLGNGMVNYKYK